MSPRHSRAELLGLGVVVNFESTWQSHSASSVREKIQERLAFVSAALGKACDAHTVGGPHPSKIMKVDISHLQSGTPAVLYWIVPPVSTRHKPRPTASFSG